MQEGPTRMTRNPIRLEKDLINMTVTTTCNIHTYMDTKYFYNYH